MFASTPREILELLLPAIRLYGCPIYTPWPVTAEAAKVNGSRVARRVRERERDEEQQELLLPREKAFVGYWDLNLIIKPQIHI